jgi:hypothetical protein
MKSDWESIAVGSKLLKNIAKHNNATIWPPCSAAVLRQGYSVRRLHGVFPLGRIDA